MPPPTDLHQALISGLEHGRGRTHRLLAALTEQDLHEQPVDFLSPLVWDVGHIACFEDLWLVRRLTDRPSRDPARDQLYDAFEHPRWTRGDLPLMPAPDAMRYLDDVRRETLDVLTGLELAPDASLLADGVVHRMITQHEHQHQETMLQALDLRERHPYGPARIDPVGTTRRVDDLDRVLIPGGRFPLGTEDRRWSYDNERPQHVVEVGPFELDRFLVTARRFAAFIDDGGYDRAELWSERGWAWRCEAGHRAPQGWLRDPDGGWSRLRFGFREALDPRDPVQHISHFEAEAFARWAGGRLPTEAEWEKAASWDPATRTKRRYPWGDGPPTPHRVNLEGHRFGPAPVGSYPAGASALGVEQLAGDVYEWTSSAFDPYPGFTAFPYREYSEVFFGGDYRVLRGSSWAIGPMMARTTYRNWDHPYRRQIFAGLRVAYDRLA
ncbi:MAG: ergothioneine biosynthesis protein EgtB [Nitriliruptoraceae bacterium]